MNPAPLVSIIVCTFNGEKFLGPQLDSLVQQSYPHLEILVCDDCSTDSTVSIARSYADNDRRISIHTNPVNLGYNRNFEQAFNRAGGQFIAISDQDDIWDKRKIEKLLSLCTEEDVLLVHAQSLRFTDTIPGISHYTARQFFEGGDVRKLMFFNTIAGHNMFFRKQLLSFASPFPEKVFYDWWLAICAAAHGKIKGTDEVLTYHRFHSGNVTLGKKDEGRQTRNKAEERLHTLEQIRQLKVLDPAERSFAEKLYTALATIRGKKFSMTLFLFLAANADIIFFFKKRSWFSRLKMAYRMSFAIE